MVGDNKLKTITTNTNNATYNINNILTTATKTTTTIGKRKDQYYQPTTRSFSC